MLDKNKLFIIIYVDVRGIHDSDVVSYIKAITSPIEYDESIVKLIIPTRESETRVECINPVVLSPAQYEKTEKTLKRLKKKVEEAIKEINKGYE
jgi:hypothetical protein